jgi:hypothetical protein
MMSGRSRVLGTRAVREFSVLFHLSFFYVSYRCFTTGGLVGVEELLPWGTACESP